MADVLTGNPYVKDSQEPRDHNRTIQRVLLVLVILLSVLLVGELVYHLAIAPRLAISSIEVDNSSDVAEQELLSAAGIRAGMMFFSVNAQDLATRLEAFPSVRSASVSLTFPNKMRVLVTGREPLACAPVETQDGLRIVVFDDEGVVFRVLDEPVVNSLPVISGLSFPAAQVGLRLPALLIAFLEDLRALQQQSPELFALFSEFRVVRRNDAAFDIVLYPVHFSVPVRIGRRIDAGMVEYIVMMLETLRREGRLGEIAEIDFRTGEGVIRAKGGDRG